MYIIHQEVFIFVAFEGPARFASRKVLPKNQQGPSYRGANEFV